MSARSARLLLYGVFQKLREAGLPLQIRDYLEGLQALRLYGGLEPFETLSGVKPEARASTGRERPGKSFTHRVRTGAELVWLCQVLWARSDSERSIVERVITLEIGVPPPRLIRELHELLISPGPDSPEDGQSEPASVVPFESSKQQDSVEQAATVEQADGGGEAAGSERQEQKSEEGAKEGAKEADTFPVEIVAEEEGALALPPLGRSEISDDPTYLPTEPPIISPLWLVALWRRFFIPVRKADAVEIDAAATVRSAARSGRIVAPVMKLRRKNTAKLLLLIDSSEAMTPWRQFEAALVDSLAPGTSRLSAVEIRYFNGVPGRKAFAGRTLRKGEPTEEVLRRNGGSPVLVVGEGGVVRPRTDVSFRERLKRFLALASEFENRPLIWVNPMPQRRWPGSLMELLKGQPNVHAVELNPETLLRAVDLMRGVAG